MKILRILSIVVKFILKFQSIFNVISLVLYLQTSLGILNLQNQETKFHL